jgi:hyperosmotically inducible protein
MKARFLPLVTLFALLVLPGAANAQEDRRDVQLADKVASAISQYTRYTVFDDIGGVVDQGVVTLTGKVTMGFKRDDIAKRVARLDGVKSVNNQIGLLPTSIYDDQLRSRISRAIYGSSAFWPYASMVNPPIHIIVENGRVTLTGVVLSKVDRLLAQSLATGRGELAVTNALRTEM